MEVNNTDVFQTLCHANFNDVNMIMHNHMNASISTRIASTILLRSMLLSIQFYPLL